MIDSSRFRSEIAYIALKLFCNVPNRRKVSGLVLYILKMRKSKAEQLQIAMQETKHISDVFEKLEAGEYPTFESFASAFNFSFSKMKPYERMSALIELKSYYNDFRNAKNKSKAKRK